MFAHYNMNYAVKIYSRIGELIQGILPDRSSFLVSGLPSRTLYSEAILEDGPHESIRTPDPASTLPPKAREALCLFLQAHLARNEMSPTPLTGKSIRLHSNIPPGKGLSSSSADVLSVLYVVNDYLQAGFTTEDLYRIAARVEPTDPCLSRDIVLFKQHLGVIERSIPLPSLTLLYFDAASDRQIDTLSLQRAYTGSAPHFFDGLLRRFMQSAEEKDHTGLLDCITQSATYNQSILPLPRFGEYHRFAAEAQTGLMVAHSGTIIGFLTRPEQSAILRERLEVLANRYRSTPVYTENYFSPAP
jgi:uncharacterized protein involved in propanediol utilization